MFLMLVCGLAATGGVVATAAESATVAPAWPKIGAEQRPWVRWWWHGSAVQPADLTADLASYAAAGFGGVELTPIYGIRGGEAEFIPFLSSTWVDRLEHTVRETRRLGLGLDVANGTGWPFGGPWIDDAHAPRAQQLRRWTVAGGTTLAEPVTAMQEPLLRTVRRGATTLALLREPLAANPDLQALALDQVRFAKPLPLAALTAYPPAGDTRPPLDLTGRVAADGRLDWTAPAGGAWELHALFAGWHGKLVERAAPGGEGLVIDHFSREALATYLARFDAALAGRDLAGVRAWFNDSYEVDDASGQGDWTPRFFEEFARRRGYDLRPHLRALAGAGEPDAATRVLSDYRETVSDLMLDQFTAPWRQWATARGAIIRNQAHGSPANILDLYAASDIPETEGDDVLSFKFASSAARLSGRSLAAAEAFTWLDEHGLPTLAAAKRAVDGFFLGGINHLVYHGSAHTPVDEPWPGRLFYAAVAFQRANPWWVDLPVLNAYVARTQAWLQRGVPDADVLLYYPMHDVWTEPPTRRGLLQHFHGPQGSSAHAAGTALLAAGYTFDFVSDRLLAGARPQGGGVALGGARYRAVVVSACRLMPVETLARLGELAREGVPVIFESGPPKDVPGASALAVRRAEFARLVSALPAGAREVSAALPAALARAGVAGEPFAGAGLKFERRRVDEGWVYLLVNDGTAAFAGWLPLGRAGADAAIFDALTGQAGRAHSRVAADGAGREVWLELAPGESRLVHLPAVALPERTARFPAWQPAGGAEPVAGAWQVAFSAGGPELPAASTQTALRSWTEWAGEAGRSFAGTAVYRLALVRPRGAAGAAVAAWELDLGAVAESARVRWNGQEIAALIAPPWRVVVPAAAWREGENVLEVEVTNLMANRLADADRRGLSWKRYYNINMPARRRENTGADGLFTAAAWEPLRSGLLGPVTLTPLAPRAP